MISKLLVSLMLTVAVSGSASATFSVSYEAPGIQNSTAKFAFRGVETFDGQAKGNNKGFTTNFGTGGVINGTYTGVNVDPASQYGGAGGTGNFAVTFSTAGYSLDLTTTDKRGINYFGYWLSALDPGNVIQFYSGGTLVDTFTPTDVIAAIGNKKAYFGNPNAPFLGSNSGEPYAFINVYDHGGTFDRVVFSEAPQKGGYESDNHTVGFFTKGGGTTVPEPASIAVLGLGLLGIARLRRR